MILAWASPFKCNFNLYVICLKVYIYTGIAVKVCILFGSIVSMCAINSIYLSIVVQDLAGNYMIRISTLINCYHDEPA